MRVVTAESLASEQPPAGTHANEPQAQAQIQAEHTGNSRNHDLARFSLILRAPPRPILSPTPTLSFRQHLQQKIKVGPLVMLSPVCRI